jgi:hypothetical protein
VQTYFRHSIFNVRWLAVLAQLCTGSFIWRSKYSYRVSLHKIIVNPFKKRLKKMVRPKRLKAWPNPIRFLAPSASIARTRRYWDDVQIGQHVPKLTLPENPDSQIRAIQRNNETVGMIRKLDRHLPGIGFFQANRNQKTSAVFMEPADERPLVTWDSARHVLLLVWHVIFTKPAHKGALDAGSWQFFIHHGIHLSVKPTVSKLVRWNVSHAVAGFIAYSGVTGGRSLDHTGVSVAGLKIFDLHASRENQHA